MRAKPNNLQVGRTAKYPIWHQEHQTNPYDRNWESKIQTSPPPFDYRLKTHELMKKNTELELQVRQSEKMIAHLQQEIRKMNISMLSLIDLINRSGEGVTLHNNLAIPQKPYYKNKSMSNCPSSLQTHIEALNVSNLHEKSQEKSVFTNVLSSENMEGSSVSSGQGYTTDYDYAVDWDCPADYNPSLASQQCLEYESKFNDIITEYKQIVTQQHHKSMRMQTNLKNQVAQAEDRIKQLQVEINCLQDELTKSKQTQSKMQKQIKQYEMLAVKEQQLVERIEEFESQLQTEEEKHVAEIQVLEDIQLNCQKTIRELENTVKQLDGEMLSKNQVIQELTDENQGAVQREGKIRQEYQSAVQQRDRLQQECMAVVQERDNLQEKYKQEFRHFEQMEEIVEKKLIEVEYEMNYYKQERSVNMATIRDLTDKCRKYEKELAEYKMPVFGSAEKSMGGSFRGSAEEDCPESCYSFGEDEDELRDKEGKNSSGCGGELSIQQSLFILKNQRGQSSQGNNSEPSDQQQISANLHCSFPSQQLKPQQLQEQFQQELQDSSMKEEAEEDPTQISHQTQMPSDLSKQESPLLDSTENNPNWEEHCYQQSIKTLLQENQKLKKLFLNQGIRQKLTKEEEQELEMEYKILSSTLHL